MLLWVGQSPHIVTKESRSLVALDRDSIDTRLEELLALRMQRRLRPGEEAEYRRLAELRLASRRGIDLTEFERVRA